MYVLSRKYISEACLSASRLVLHRRGLLAAYLKILLRTPARRMPPFNNCWREKESCFRSQTSFSRDQMSEVRCQSSDIRSHAFGVCAGAGASKVAGCPTKDRAESVGRELKRCFQLRNGRSTR